MDLRAYMVLQEGVVFRVSDGYVGVCIIFDDLTS
jgi:hypothetical protein